MIDESCKIAIQEKIISSKAFSNSDKYVELLKFLIQCNIKNVYLKEFTIAEEVFSKDKKFNPASDSQVRIYMHRIRDKIKLYYENEGKNDKVIINIPKGHYEIQFQEKDTITRNITNKLSRLNIILLGTILILIITLTLIIIHYTSHNQKMQIVYDPISKTDPIWADFFNNKLSTKIVIGDDFLFWQLDEEHKLARQVIDYAIPNMSEFEQYAKKHPEQMLEMERHGALPLNCAWNIYDLTHVFYSFNQQVDIELSSLFIATPFDLTNLVDRNIIYIGGFRNLRQFNNLLAKLPLDYQYTDLFKGFLSVKHPENDSLMTFTGQKLSNQYHRDIGLIVKVGGSNNENYLFLVGFAFPSQIETVRLLSRKNLLAKVYSQIHLDKPEFPEHFFMIIEILASEFSAIETNVKYFQEIPSKLQK
ncbi:hypothetical protein JW964_03640 [candidate division KSB1 bacterium]|nr:hypothetical protein [candidate division KSB1 bacterium]